MRNLPPDKPVEATAHSAARAANEVEPPIRDRQFTGEAGDGAQVLGLLDNDRPELAQAQLLKEAPPSKAWERPRRASCAIDIVGGGGIMQRLGRSLGLRKPGLERQDAVGGGGICDAG
jgi:hypothetical protein